MAFAIALVTTVEALAGIPTEQFSSAAPFLRPDAAAPHGGPVALPYMTGFEAVEGFVAGSANGQSGWATNPATSPQVSAANPGAGLQHLRINDDPTDPPGFPGVLAFSPSHAATADRVLVDVFISATGGADYLLNPQSAALGCTSHRVDFNFGDVDGDTIPGDILVFNDTNGPAAGGIVFVNTGVEYTPGVYKTLEIRFVGTNVETYYDNALIATTTVVHNAAGIPCSAFSETVILDDQFQALGEFADFDNFSVIPEPGTLTLIALAGLALIRRRR
jgi:hypothetical protein